MPVRVSLEARSPPLHSRRARTAARPPHLKTGLQPKGGCVRRPHIIAVKCMLKPSLCGFACSSFEMKMWLNSSMKCRCLLLARTLGMPAYTWLCLQQWGTSTCKIGRLKRDAAVVLKVSSNQHLRRTWQGTEAECQGVLQRAQQAPVRSLRRWRQLVTSFVLHSSHHTFQFLYTLR